MGIRRERGMSWMRWIDGMNGMIRRKGGLMVRCATGIRSAHSLDSSSKAYGVIEICIE